MSKPVLSRPREPCEACGRILSKGRGGKVGRGVGEGAIQVEQNSLNNTLSRAVALPLAPCGITSDLAAVIWQPSRMASGFIRRVGGEGDRKSTRLNSSHAHISY